MTTTENQPYRACHLKIHVPVGFPSNYEDSSSHTCARQHEKMVQDSTEDPQVT